MSTKATLDGEIGILSTDNGNDLGSLDASKRLVQPRHHFRINMG